MLIYLAHPVDLAQNYQGHDVVLWLHSNLADLGPTFDPSEAWSVRSNMTPTAELQDANLNVLLCCDVLVAYLPDGVPTIGTVLEVMEFTRGIAGKPVILVVGSGTIKRSWALAYFIQNTRNARLVDEERLIDEWEDIKAWLSDSHD